MAFRFKDLFLKTYNATGTVDGVEIHSTVKTKNIFNVVAEVEKEFPGFQWTGVHQAKKPFDLSSIFFLGFAITCIVLSLIIMAVTSTFSWVIVMPTILGFFSVLTLREDKSFDPYSFAGLFLSLVFTALILVGMATFGTAPWVLIIPIILGSFSIFTLWRFSPR